MFGRSRLPRDAAMDVLISPDRIHARVEELAADIVRAYDGTNAWWQLPLTVTPQYPLTATLLEGQKFDAVMAFPWRARTYFNNWRVSFGQTIDGTDVDAIENYTNRSPYPTLHLIREESIDRAVAAFPEAETIYETNIQTMNKLGIDGWRRLFADD